MCAESTAWSSLNPNPANTGQSTPRICSSSQSCTNLFLGQEKCRIDQDSSSQSCTNLLLGQCRTDQHSQALLCSCPGTAASTGSSPLLPARLQAATKVLCWAGTSPKLGLWAGPALLQQGLNEERAEHTARTP